MNNLSERIGSATFLVFTAGYLVLAVQLPSDSPNLSDLGPRIYPLLLGIIATVISVFWTARSFRPGSAKESSEVGEDSESDHSGLKVTALIAVAIAFPLALESVGFILTTSIVLFLLCNVIMWKKPTIRQIVISGIFAILSSISLQFLFENIMAIYLP